MNNYIISNNIQPYDLVIRIRPDILLSETISIDDITHALSGKLCATMLLTMSYVLGYKDFISDTFFFSTPKVMDQMSTLYDEFKRLKKSCTNPEAFLFNFIKHKKIDVHFLKTEVVLIDYDLTSNKYYIVKMISKIRNAPILDIKNCLLLDNN